MPDALELPNFLVIGAAKSGTTALYELLAQHPQVFLPYAKETRFFNSDSNYDRGSAWYQRTYFRNSGAFPARGEATPHYLYWSEKVAPRIAAACSQGEVKLIAILRDPVKRAYSQYWMDVQRGVETLPFAEALEAETDRLASLRPELEPEGLLKFGYFRGGCYATLLEPFLQRFPRSHFHFLLLEDLQADFSGTMKVLSDFLGVESDFTFQPSVSNTSYAPRNRSLNIWYQNRPERFFRFLRALRMFIPESHRYGLRKTLLSMNRKPQSNPPMERAVEMHLRRAYQEEISRLEMILERDLAAWKRMTY